MKSLLAILMMLALALSAQPQQVVSQYSITIQNPSFETPTVLPETFDCPSQIWDGYMPGSTRVGRTIPGWTQHAPGQMAYPSGIAQWDCLPQSQFRPGNPLEDSAYLPPDGQNVAFLGDAEKICQDLKVPLQAGTYTLKFYTANWGYSYPGKLRASILGGQHEICNSDTWALGAWVENALPCSVPGYLASNSFGWTDFGNGNVNICFQHSQGWIVLLDEVSLWRTDPAFVHN